MTPFDDNQPPRCSPQRLRELVDQLKDRFGDKLISVHATEWEFVNFDWWEEKPLPISRADMEAMFADLRLGTTYENPHTIRARLQKFAQWLNGTPDYPELCQSDHLKDKPWGADYAGYLTPVIQKLQQDIADREERTP